MRTVTVNLQVNSRYGDWRFLLGDNQVSLCNLAATCAVWDTCQECVWASTPGSGYFLLLFCKRVVVLLSWWWSSARGNMQFVKAWCPRPARGGGSQGWLEWNSSWLGQGCVKGVGGEDCQEGFRQRKTVDIGIDMMRSWTENVEVKILSAAEEHENSHTRSNKGSISAVLCSHQGLIASA